MAVKSNKKAMFLILFVTQLHFLFTFRDFLFNFEQYHLRIFFVRFGRFFANVSTSTTTTIATTATTTTLLLEPLNTAHGQKCPFSLILHRQFNPSFDFQISTLFRCRREGGKNKSDIYQNHFMGKLALALTVITFATVSKPMKNEKNGKICIALCQLLTVRRTRTNRPRSVYFIFHVFACGLFKKQVCLINLLAVRSARAQFI